MVALKRFALSRPVSLATFAAPRCFASSVLQQPTHSQELHRDIDKARNKHQRSERSNDSQRKSERSRPEASAKTRRTSDRVNRDSGGPPAANYTGKPPRKMASRIIVPDVDGFYSRDGTLVTTPESAQFFLETGIESDHGQLWSITHPGANRFRKMGIEVSFSNRYAINPYHLRAFAPRGDPLAASRRRQYEALLQNQPLWVHSLVPFSSKPAVVRHTCTRRLAYCTRRAAEKLAEENPPVVVRGTVLIFVRDAIKAVNMPAQEFEDMMVEALRKEVADLERKKHFG